MRYNPIKDIRQDIARHFLVMLAINITLLIIISGLAIYFEYEIRNVKKQEQILLEKVQMVDEAQKNIMFYRLPSLPEKETAEAEVQGTTLTTADKEYITRVCMAEAGNDYDGCLAVAQCIYDRSILWKKSPYEIASAYKQFAQPRMGALYSESARAVTDVFENHKRAFEGSNVTHFYSGNITPYWVEGKRFVGERGGNRFYI